MDEVVIEDECIVGALSFVKKGQYPKPSNMMVVGKEKSDGQNALLLNGPQFGWFNPAYVYGVGLHNTKFDNNYPLSSSIRW